MSAKHYEPVHSQEEGKRMFKVIITDLDRTLLHTDKTISPYTLEVLKRCKEKGMLLMAATARPLRAIEVYRKQLAFDALTVMNGAQVICGEHVERYQNHAGICGLYAGGGNLLWG